MLPILNKVHNYLRANAQQNLPLFLLVLFSALCLLLSLSGLAVDHRSVNGEFAWAKPCKFSASLAVYGITLVWFSHYLTQSKAFYKTTCWASFVGTVVELSAIIMQVLRGTSSHFNSSTGFDHCVFAVITIAIMPVAFNLFALFALLIREPELPEVLGLSIKWGVLLTIIGLIPGVLMLLPDSLRDTIFSYRHFAGHGVGAGLNERNLPFIGWSAIAGDLRVAHFMGIHGLQVLPFVGLALDRLAEGVSSEKQKQLVWNAGVTYLTFMILLTWQALHAESIAAPSVRTIAIALITVSFSTLAFACTMWSRRSVTESVLTPFSVELL